MKRKQCGVRENLILLSFLYYEKQYKSIVLFVLYDIIQMRIRNMISQYEMNNKGRRIHYDY